jgi:hypothetical protein
MLFDNEWIKNKFKYYELILQMDAVYWSEKYKLFVITRYNDVMYALQNPNIFRLKMEIWLLNQNLDLEEH